MAGVSRPLNILILYDGVSVPVNAIRDHMEAFRLFSRHRIYYAHAAFEAPLRFSLALFDAVVLHFSLRLPMRHHLSSAFYQPLREYQGLKALFIQDEYDHPWLSSERIAQLGIDVVFTNIPPQHVRTVYARVPERVEFFQNLTGYLPLNFDFTQPVRPLQQRPLLVGYRGRPLAYNYGRLGNEKIVIARRMRAICQARNLPHDIEWAEQKRIYGSGWNDFIQSCRTVLGTESGSNLFDYDGTLRTRIQEALLRKPDMTFEEAYARFLEGKEVDGMMNQVSPRIFEAVALRTGLILFEGTYSGVVRPDEHYLSLKKDFSNVDEVLARAQDERFLRAMIDRAYDHVIGSGLWTYQQFVRWVEQVLEPRVESKLATLRRRVPALRAANATPPSSPLPEAGRGSKTPDRLHCAAAHTQPEPLLLPSPLRGGVGGGVLLEAPLETELARLLESREIEHQPRQRAHPSRLVEALWVARASLLDPARSLPRLGRVAWNLLVRLVWATPLRLLKKAGNALVKMGRMLPALLGDPLLRRGLRQGRALAGELSRLVILRQARLLGPRTLGFELVGRVQSGPGGLSLLLLSLPVGPPRQPAQDGVSERVDLESGPLREIVWDHSAMGASIRYPFQGKLTATFPLGTHGVHRFGGLVELARSQPELVRALLRWALAVPETARTATRALPRRAG